MNYRLRKQIFIVLILLVVFGLIGAGVYYKWFYQAPSCTDGVQNQTEEGVDCGGPCQVSCERLTIKNIETQWAKAVLLKDNTYDLVAKLNNPNPNYGLEKFSYTFKIFDDSGQVIAQVSGNSFILPAQEKYIIEGNAVLSAVPAKVDFVIDNSPKSEWQLVKTGFNQADIYIENKQFKFLENQPAVAQASGVIKNNSVFDFEQILVSVVLLDDSQEIIGVNKTEARTVPAGEERYFSINWFSPLVGEVRSIEMRAETNLFSDENFMRRYGTQEKWQQY